MGIFEKAKVAEQVSATGETFVLASTIEELKQQQLELKAELSKDLDNYQRAILDTRLDYVEDRLRELTKKKRKKEIISHEPPEQPRKRAKRTPTSHPWDWPGPIAPAGMEAVKLPDQTYNHCSTTDPQYASEEATAKDYEKVVAWAERFNWSSQIIAAHWGALVSRGTGPVYTKTNLLLLQERIRAICNERVKNGIWKHVKEEQEKPKLGLFSKAKEATPKEPTAQKTEVITESTAEVIADQWAEQKYEDACGRLLDAGFIMYTEIQTREQADEILYKRSMAALELGLVYEQFEKAKKGLISFIEDISLVFDDQLEEFMKKNNPTGKKTWSLQYGDLKLANKPESISLDTDRDPDESMFQAWLKTQHDKQTPAVEAIEIRPLVSFARDMKKFKEWYQAEYAKTGKPPAIPGIKRTPAQTNAFSISPSIDTIKKNIKEDLKEKGLR